MRMRDKANREVTHIGGSYGTRLPDTQKPNRNSRLSGGRTPPNFSMAWMRQKL